MIDKALSFHCATSDQHGREQQSRTEDIDSSVESQQLLAIGSGAVASSFFEFVFHIVLGRIICCINGLLFDLLNDSNMEMISRHVVCDSGRLCVAIEYFLVVGDLFVI
ncbi:hypothetical protein EON65_23195 [archaeon]|nr:MAG: hypothetical protein EON65_23195 [archaeon]